MMSAWRKKAVQAEPARSESLAHTIAAREASVRALEEIEKYLDVTAPPWAVVTERQAHAGALVGSQGRHRWGNPGEPPR